MTGIANLVRMETLLVRKRKKKVTINGRNARMEGDK